MKKKLILLIIIILFSVNITGCWDMIDLSDRQLILAIGIDKAENNKIKLTIQSTIPDRIGTAQRAGSEIKKVVNIISTTASTFNEALNLYTLRIKGNPSFEHLRAIVIGEAFAKEGVAPLMDFFIRYHQSNTRCFILTCKGNASDIINWQGEENKIPTDQIVSSIKARSSIATSINENLHQFILKLASDATSPSITRIDLINKAEGFSVIDIGNTGVFNKDKLVGWLDNTETKGLAWILSEFRNGTIDVKNEKSNISLTYDVTNYKTTIKPEVENGKIKIILDVDTEGRIIQQDGSLDFTIPNVMDKAEEDLGREIENEINACILKVQKDYKTDIFGFGEEVHRNYPVKWKSMKANWDSTEFPDLKVEVNAKAKITSTELITNTIKP